MQRRRPIPKNPPSLTPSLTHLDDAGHARMVDVSAKTPSPRVAVASAEVRTTPEVLRLIADGQLPKGDALAVARIAGIQAAKQTSRLIPLCHPLPIEAISVDLQVVPPDRVRIEASVTVVAKTGVEMEALTAVSVAALTLYDMCKSADKAITIGPIQLESKTGGKSGPYRRAT